MERTITLFEHECTSGFDWTNRDLAVLERLSRAAGPELLRPVVRGGKRELRALQHVGVFRLGDRTVQVLPKIYQSGEAADGVKCAEATRNLLHLLQVAGDVPIREQGLASLLRRDVDWFEILTRMFAEHLREEWQLRGQPKLRSGRGRPARSKGQMAHRGPTPQTGAGSPVCRRL